MWSGAGSSAGSTKLILHIRNVEGLENGVPTLLELDQRGAVIGRSPMVDWSLPDPHCFISSRHCQVEYQGGQYRLIDISTNGTYLNGGSERLTAPHTLKNGDLILIGHYEVTVSLNGAAVAPSAPPPQPASWQGWESHSQGAASGVDPASWDQAKPMPAISGRGAMSGNWTPPAPDAAGASGAFRPPNDNWGPPPAAPNSGGREAAPSQWGSPPPPAPASGGWADNSAQHFQAPPPSAPAYQPSSWEAPAPAQSPASGWSSPAADKAPLPSADDIWGQLAEGNVVDWARGGFGQAPAPAPEPQHPLGLRSPPPPQPVPMTPPPAPSPAAASGGYAAGGTADLGRFLQEAGLQRDTLKLPDGDALAAAGGLLRRLVAGLVVMLEARARAKSQMGTQSTSLEFDGNNPIKFARTPEQALAQLLNPPERGFMPADRAVEDAFHDLQSHQVATLKAMQGALKSTLDRFSPSAIKQRAEAKGLMQRIMPGAHNAALWEAYEREFGGVAKGSDEAFMDVFAKEFRRAYEEQSAQRRRGR